MTNFEKIKGFSVYDLARVIDFIQASSQECEFIEDGDFKLSNGLTWENDVDIRLIVEWLLSEER